MGRQGPLLNMGASAARSARRCFCPSRQYPEGFHIPAKARSAGLFLLPAGFPVRFPGISRDQGDFFLLFCTADIRMRAMDEIEFHRQWNLSAYILKEVF
ncbi:MAG: hypothetical protein Q4G00_13160 [Clostridia bacterium]|nr:hypothetical protein [Clostridia bacterium]